VKCLHDNNVGGSSCYIPDYNSDSIFSNHYYCSDAGAKYIRITNVRVTTGNRTPIRFILRNKYGSIYEDKSAPVGGGVTFGPFQRSDLVRLFYVESIVDTPQYAYFDLSIETY
jgi:hypothetical protein